MKAITEKGVLSVKMNFFTSARQHDWLICVDSDGCAIDTMDVKHIRCFGPCMVAEWGLESWAEPILARWNEINLYTMTRGINRFKGLSIALTEIDRQYKKIDGIEELIRWVDSGAAPSNDAVLAAYEATQCEIFKKALSWSKAVNIAIDALPMETKKAFPGVAEGLATAHKVADVVVVSSANKDAVTEEWKRYGLLDNVDYLMCQDAGTKVQCIARLKEMGYATNHILMCGDAPGDKTAAEKNGVYFYPILVRHEAESWSEFQQALIHLLNGSYASYGAAKAEEFLQNLS